MIIKKRVIAYQKTGEKIYGITIPKELNEMIEDTEYFSIEISGTSLICLSGCNPVPTPEQIDSYKFEDVRI